MISLKIAEEGNMADRKGKQHEIQHQGIGDTVEQSSENIMH